MGTDIHAGIEWRENGAWHALKVPNKYHGRWGDEPELTYQLDIDRDYSLFAILADVRNSYGFAGCDLGDKFNSITSRRGLPEDITAECREHACTGDHSETWAGLRELLEYDWQQIATRRGVVDPIQFEEWDRKKLWQPEPTSYCGDTSGPGIVYVSEDEMREYVKGIVGSSRGAEWHAAISQLKQENAFGSPVRRVARVTWKLPYAESGRQIWTKILPSMLSLGKTHGLENVRLVMNFDS